MPISELADSVYLSTISVFLLISHWNFAVHALQVEIGELKGRLTEVISNCNALCRRIEVEGPESLRSSLKPFSVTTVDPEIQSSSSSVQRVNHKSPPCTET